MSSLKPGYYRIGDEGFAIWPASQGDRTDFNPRTRKPYMLGWRSDYAMVKGRSVVMVDMEDGPEMMRLAGEGKPVSQAEWVEWMRTGQWPVALVNSALKV